MIPCDLSRHILQLTYSVRLTFLHESSSTIIPQAQKTTAQGAVAALPIVENPSCHGSTLELEMSKGALPSWQRRRVLRPPWRFAGNFPSPQHGEAVAQEQASRRRQRDEYRRLCDRTTGSQAREERGTVLSGF